eukprot:gene17625-9266_t
MLLKPLGYKLNIVYKPGNQMHIADTLSRAFVRDESSKDISFDLNVQSVMMYFPASKSNIEEWQKVGEDFFNFAGKDYLLVVEYFSKHPEIANVRNKSASSVVQAMKIALHVMRFYRQSLLTICRLIRMNLETLQNYGIFTHYVKSKIS